MIKTESEKNSLFLSVAYKMRIMCIKPVFNYNMTKMNNTRCVILVEDTCHELQ
jgi:hypothetical protein